MRRHRPREFMMAFEVGVILGTQVSRRVCREGEYALCSSVMSNAIEYLRKFVKHPNTSEYREAIDWVIDDAPRPWSFSWVCDHINIPADDTRDKILAWVKKGCPKLRRCKTEGCPYARRQPSGLCQYCLDIKARKNALKQAA